MTTAREELAGGFEPAVAQDDRRTVGVEEELLLVDATTGEARSRASEVLHRAAYSHADTAAAEPGTIGHELHQQQVETDTPPLRDLDDLEASLTAWRTRAREAAAEWGCLLLATGTAPLPVSPVATEEARYQRIAARFGRTAGESLSCGLHVHVAVDTDEEAVAVLDRIRCWLPVLLALSGNSPYWQGEDTGYASCRSRVQIRWPTCGPTPVFGSAVAYDDYCARLLATGVPDDRGMLYFDARRSHRYPTVEVRVADACLGADEAAMIAALVRALVDTAALEWQAGQEPPEVDAAMIRLAMWQAARYGLSGDLLDPRPFAPVPAARVVELLLEHVGPALAANGDLARVTQGVTRILARGTGAARQRECLERNGSLRDAVLALAELSCPRAW